MNKRNKNSKTAVKKTQSASPDKNINPSPPEGGIAKFSLKYQLALLCAIIGFLLYTNTLNHGYTGDDGMVTKNNKFTTQGIKAIPEILKTSYRQGFWERKEGLYRPLSLVMFAIEHQLSPDNPFINHFFNVFLYALTGFILFLTMSSLLQNRNLIIPLITTILFIAHPIHTEVVANIKSRDEILSLLFTICSFYFLSIYIIKQSKLSLVFTGVSFFLALLSKESALPCIVIAPLAAWWFAKDFSVKKLLSSLLAYGIATALYLAVRFAVLGALTNFEQISTINNSLAAAPDFLSHYATAMLILGKYLVLLFFPYSLSSDYSFNQIPNISLSNPFALLSILIYIAIVIYIIKNIKSKDLIAFGMLYFILAISIVSNILFLIESVMAERFLYLPSLGFALAFAALLTKVFKTDVNEKNFSFSGLLKKNKALFGIVALLFILFSFKTISRNADWKNDLTLLKKDAQSSPESARIRCVYGRNILIDEALKETDPTSKNNYLDKAIEQLEKSVSILNTYGDAYYYLGIAYKEKGDFATAVKDLELADKNKVFEDADFHLQSGIAHAGISQYDKAIEDFKQAVALNPQSFDGYLNLGVYYDVVGKHNESIDALKRAAELNPNSYKPYYNLGNTYVHIGNYSQAIDWYKKSETLNPSVGSSYNNIANCYVSLKDYPQAMEYYKKALEVDPHNTDALNNINVVKSLMGKN